MIIIANPSQSSTLAGRSKNPTHDQNQPKSLSAQTHGRPNYDLIDKMTRNNKGQLVTKAICNLGNMPILKLIALNKISGKLKVNCFKIPYYA
ncbi:MAG: hypothetical protein B6D64_13550 [Bacteroidetes bacterium 4484_276]|nr:MAG: hypothetical protein B6D64_13550 [Bacteroidetes bacterium 4484_276]